MVEQINKNKKEGLELNVYVSVLMDESWKPRVKKHQSQFKWFYDDKIPFLNG